MEDAALELLKAQLLRATYTIMDLTKRYAAWRVVLAFLKHLQNAKDLPWYWDNYATIEALRNYFSRAMGRRKAGQAIYIIHALALEWWGKSVVSKVAVEVLNDAVALYEKKTGHKIEITIADYDTATVHWGAGIEVIVKVRYKNKQVREEHYVFVD